jgi:pimeloyl-ACP methyl ester carboxylesterase
MRNGVPCLAVWPPPGSPVSLASWCREMAALLAETISPSRFPENAARGAGQPVVVVPGFCQPEIATAPLRKFLQRQGFAPGTWRCGPNFGPTSSCLAKFERYVVRLAEERGQPVSLVGISLGGTMARELAKHRPDCIRRVVTLCSPVRLPVPTPLAPIAGFAAMHWDKRRWNTLGQIGIPPPVPVTAIVNPTDGILDWRSSVPEPAPNVEVFFIEGAHTTIGSNPRAQTVIASRLSA